MPRKFICLILIFCSFLIGTISTANAGIPIPCTGESIVKVMDLKNSVNDKDGQRLALGYKFNGCFSGEWVGYVGSSSRYLKLNEPRLKLLLAMNGMTAPPAEPSRWQHPSELAYPALWMVLIGVGAGAAIMKRSRES